jgi:hypothetical protein
MPEPEITVQEPRCEKLDLDIAVQREPIWLISGIIWGKVRRMGYDGDSGPLRRAEARSSKFRQRRRQTVRIMAPWPAVG